MTLAVVKVGGSLYDLPDLGKQLRSWLAALAAPRVLLVPGGGVTADVVRDLDRCHALGEVVAHGLALRAMTLNAWFLSALLGGTVPVVNPWRERCWEGVALLDAHAFCQEVEVNQGLPALWDVTSDSVAAHAAILLGARELVLLKSTDGGEECDWNVACRRGLVDPFFPGMISKSSLTVRVVNLRRYRAPHG